jgi:hypothetical protein
VTTTDLVELEDKPLYENNNYEVVILYLGEDGEPFVDGRFVYRTIYAVMNKGTGVMEHTAIQLPDAIFTAVSLDAALEKAPWNWANEVTSAVAN